jgi:transglutaminase-like putative cysteine protease
MNKSRLLIVLLLLLLNINNIFSIEKKYKIVEINRTFLFNITNRIPNLTVFINLAQNYENRQEVLISSVNYNPDFYLDINNNKIAKIQINNIKDKKIIISTYEKIKIFKYDFSMIQYDENKEIDKGIYKYLDSKNINFNVEFSKIITEKINSDNTVDLVNQLYDFVIKDIKYKRRSDEWSGILTYNSKEGKCLDYSDYFVSLCRSKKIPARTVTGLIAVNGKGEESHAWSEVYIKGYGWIPFDLTFGDSNNSTKFNNLLNVYIYYNIGNSMNTIYESWGNKNSKIELKYTHVINITK